MKHHFHSFLTAIRFLTIIPLSLHSDRDSECFIHSVRFFVFVGFLVGLIGFGVASGLRPFLPHQSNCCVVLLFLAAVSGFLHLDGLADTADGFFSSRTRDKILIIMHDSRTGAMGVVCIFFILLFKYSSLVSITPESLPEAALLMPLAGRSAIVLSMYILPYARKEGGLGKLFYAERGIAVPFFTILFILSSLVFIEIKLLLVVLLSVVIATLLFSTWCRKKIGGATGDTLGAVCEISEMATAFSMAVYFNL